MPLSAADVDAIADLVNDLCGIALDQSKSYLIESRLSQLLARENCKSYADLAKKARLMTQVPLQTEIINAITTNETLFFRDRAPFEALQHKILPEIIDARSGSAFPRRLRIWSAACSSGQEPYSIAMTIRDMIPDAHRWDINILATDISDAVIKQASRGIYTTYEAERGLSPTYLSKYFVGEGQHWRVKDEVRSMIKFQRLNLLHPFNGMGLFDVVFCRNVAIYFAPDVRAALFRRIAAVMQPDGVLFVGSGESPGELFNMQYHCRAVVYKRRQMVSAALAC